MTAGRLFPTAPPERLAVLRILVGAFAVAYLLISARGFLSLADADPQRFEPIGVLTLTTRPMADAVLVSAYAVAVIAGLGFTIGMCFRVAGPLFAGLLFALCTYRSSWGQILWLENVMVMHVAIIGCSRAADALRWSPRGRSAPRNRPPSEAYGVPVRLAALVMVATYLLAAVAKFRLGGLAWVTSDSLRNHVAATAVRAELLNVPASPVGRWLVGHGWLFRPMAAGSALLELASPLALIGGRLRTAWVALAWLMHVAIAALMFVVFPYPLFVVAFAPFYDLEHLVGAWDRRHNRRSRQGVGEVGPTFTETTDQVTLTRSLPRLPPLNMNWSASG
jgi:hypothetical protein